MCDINFLLVLMYVKVFTISLCQLSEVIRAEAETCFLRNMQIKLYLLLLSLMIVIDKVHTKVQTNQPTNHDFYFYYYHFDKQQINPYAFSELDQEALRE